MQYGSTAADSNADRPSNMQPLHDVLPSSLHSRSSMRSRSFDSSSSPHRSISTLGLMILTFYSVSGGPFGSEPTVSLSSPLWAILGYTLFPLLWSVPESLIVAELSTAYPERSGFVAWVEEAFGHRAALVEGYLSWFSGVCDNSLYPVLFLQYLISYVGNGDLSVESDGEVDLLSYNILTRWLMLSVMITVLSYLNYRGLNIVSNTSIFICLLSLLPFMVFFCVGVGKIDASRWFAVPEGRWWGAQSVDWAGYMNILFWNLNYWDSASIFAGDVKEPGKAFPVAMFGAIILVIACYLIPLLIGIGASTADWRDWDDGYFEVVGRELAGKWLGVWIVCAAGISNISLYCAEMASDSYQLSGMADRGLLPKLFAAKSRYDTPTYSILLGSAFCMVLATFDFSELIEMVNFLYIFAQMLEFAAFLKLRISADTVYRPFRIPLSTKGCFAMLCFPFLFMLVMICLASLKTWLVCGGLFLLGVSFNFFVEVCRKRGWLEFNEMIDAKLLDGMREKGGGGEGAGAEGEGLGEGGGREEGDTTALMGG
ncbi:hypothetical protein TrVE_jg12535 [Triparma verrucosa]|uniref:Amino acid transporter n=1 Tax=Triparma verrucosa TaxID=1606542 RepID=A0A9W7FH31_9STRA|nr:hypothetical protein TrVE_jg12535 [Triparma verrucosa]